MGVMTRLESASGQCSLCRRKSEDVTTAELGDWIVQHGGTVVCSGCSSDIDRVGATEAFKKTHERVENPPVAITRLRR